MANIPNFDAMSKEELMNFWMKFDDANPKDAEELIGDCREGFVGLSIILATYALHKCIAIDLRLEGNIQAAIGYEEAADMIYDQLPADLKW